jgi:hypothetical protein
LADHAPYKIKFANKLLFFAAGRQKEVPIWWYQHWSTRYPTPGRKSEKGQEMRKKYKKMWPKINALISSFKHQQQQKKKVPENKFF